MIQSQFTKWAFIVLLTSIGLLFVVTFSIIQGEMFFSPKTPILFTIFFILFFLWMLFILILGELRTKTIFVTIDHDTILKRSFLGIGPKTEFRIDQLTGFRTSTISSKAGDFEFLYLIDNTKKVIKLSSFYHQNYPDIKSSLLRHRIKNLGTEYPSILRETFESFQW